jgi:hypothetical protein
MQIEPGKSVKVIVVADSGAFAGLQELLNEGSEAMEVAGAMIGVEGDTFTCALLDADGLFVRVETVPLSALTPLHLPRVMACDLDPAIGYRWLPTPADLANPLRGRFDPLPRKTAETKFDETEPLPALACFFIRAWLKEEAALPAQTLAWLDQYVRSHDFKGILEKSPEAQAYYLRRGLKN